MSAYGSIKRAGLSSYPLAPTIWTSKTKAGVLEDVTVYHLRKEAAQDLPGLVEYLHGTFVNYVEEGRTYPQEGEMNKETFEGYFFAEDLFLGIKSIEGAVKEATASETAHDGQEVDVTVLNAKGTRSWADTIAGFYYVRMNGYSSEMIEHSPISFQVKPNYPGRSSHVDSNGME